MRSNPLKEQLSKGEAVFGTMVFEFASPGLPAILEEAGAAYCIYDMEHSGFSFETLKHQVAAARGLNITIIARPPAKEYHFISRLLDIGVMGILLPMVETAEEAERIVSWTRYPPDGFRGAMFGGAHDGYSGGDIPAKIRIANERTLILALIETVKGLSNVDEIMAVPGIDVAHMGHFDLSLSMGVPGQVNHPEMQKAIDTVSLAAARQGKAAACMVPNVETGLDWMSRGYKMVSYSMDISLIKDSLRSGISRLRGHPSPVN
jgi:2-keto-3-deoxy-L-rhamnonate aldolase RhmA